MSRSTSEERDLFRVEIWFHRFHTLENKGACEVCGEPIDFDDSDIVINNSKYPQFIISNYTILCDHCRRLAKNIGVNAYRTQFEKSPQLKERMRKRLVHEERSQRETKRLELNDKIIGKRDKITLLENEIRLLRLEERILGDIFCERLVGNKICGKNDCEHIRISTGSDVVVGRYDYNSFQFERLNSDCQLITQPFKYMGHVVSTEYPHKVFFKLHEIPFFVLVAPIISDLTKISGFTRATESDIDEVMIRYHLGYYNEYKEAAESYLCSVYKKHRVKTIENIFKKQSSNRAFTETYNILKTHPTDMKTTRNKPIPDNIPIPLLNEINDLRKGRI